MKQVCIRTGRYNTLKTGSSFRLQRGSTGSRCIILFTSGHSFLGAPSSCPRNKIHTLVKRVRVLLKLENFKVNEENIRTDKSISGKMIVDLFERLFSINILIVEKKEMLKRKVKRKDYVQQSHGTNYLC